MLSWYCCCSTFLVSKAVVKVFEGIGPGAQGVQTEASALALAGDNSSGQQLVCCAGLSNLEWWQALAGACGRQLHRAALNCRIFTERGATTGGSQITQAIAPRERCH